MRDEDVPAALPLILFAAALGFGPALVNLRASALAFVAIAALLLIAGTPRLFTFAFFIALGLLIATRTDEEQPSFPGERFVTVEVPIEGDWSSRPHFHVLRASRFRANGQEIAAPIALYARFDPVLIAMEHHVRAEGHLRPDRRGGYTMSVKSPRLLSYGDRLPFWSPAAWNRAIANRLRKHADTRPDEIAMIEALLLGRGERLSEQTKEDFRRGGTYHLLVFSGLQISLAAGLIAMLLRWAGAARASDWSLLAFAIVAPAFIGHEASVSRASTAILLYAVSRIARRPTTFENLWCVAALVRLILVPSDLFEPAFHLTYAGAGALLFIGRPLSRSRLRWTGYAVAAEIAIAPLTLFHFHQYALGGSLMTIAMTPIIFAMLLTGALFSAIEATPLLDLIALLNSVCTAMNRLAAPASGFFAAPATASIVAGYALAAGAIATLRGNARTAAIAAALLVPPIQAAVLFHRLATVSAPRFIAFDVGQGDALLLRGGRQAMLIDGGGRREDVRFGESVLLPLLLDRGVRTLDAVVLTHAHPDHCGGLAAVIRHLHVRELWISPRRFRGHCAHIVLEAARAKATPIRLLEGGETIELSGVKAEVTILRKRFRRAPENNNSVLVRASIGKRSILLTGDIERDGEREIADLPLQADILKVPHHGSRTSTSAELLERVRPRIAVISCGRNNFFGHPHPAVVQALRRRQIRIWRTDHQGTLEIVFRQDHIAVLPEIDTFR